MVKAGKLQPLADQAWKQGLEVGVGVSLGFFFHWTFCYRVESVLMINVTITHKEAGG